MDTSNRKSKRFYLHMKFRATTKLARSLQKPGSPAAVLSSLFRDGATGIETFVKLVSFRRKYNSFVYVFMLAVTLTLICKGIRDYCKYETSTSMKLVDDVDRILPLAITICNTNGFKKSVFCSAENLAVTKTLCEVRKKSKFAGLIMNMSFNPDTYRTLRMITDLSTFTARELIKSCYRKRKPCPPGTISPQIVSYLRYGVCYCLFCKQKMRGLDAQVLKSHLHDEGLSLILESHNEEKLKSTKTAGFIVMLHDPNLVPDVVTNGFYIADGHTSYAGISFEAVTRLPEPYTTNCRSEWPPGFDKPPFSQLPLLMPYSTSLCVRVCWSLYILQHCKCRYNERLSHRDYLDIASLCMESNETQVCSREAASRTISCNCPPRCSERIYRAALSSASFVKSNRTLLANDTHKESRSYSHLLLYYSKNQAPIFIEVEKINRVQLVNILGGNFGMFVGASFLVFYELFEIHVRWLLNLVKVRYLLK
ncbi:acid-sensing ion channel 1A-like [Varroa jacobsoni]|uniref:acid-sensing ion channel 1A-like n=1 Tax=Varroa jacobsoni TaxID=62625 RepID=UPI000BF4AE48|nr:acid-sensing ion channel 1A-like [Varroa jacobsoni]XP_022699876.1 acid-sensing ion channel 1A-like [Varroa jacobsoni]